MSPISTSISVVDVFIDIYHTLNRIVFYKTGRSEVSQDITQEIYLRIISIANDFPTHDDARNYLIRVALNAASDYRRTELRRSQILGGAIHLFENYSPSPEVSVHYQEQFNMIDTALASLPQKCRDILYLSRVEGLTYTEIAERLGVSVSLVEKYAIRALLFCRKNIEMDVE